MKHSKPPLPSGESDFARLRQSGAVYVDKTELVFELASSYMPVLLVRPRRFGKSLLVSTFESLFRHGLRDFQGLAIEKLWNDRIYDVVRLDFSTCKGFGNWEDFCRSFDKTLLDAFGEVGFRKTDDSTDLALQISFWMSTLERGSLVVLVDEYDAPLRACWDDLELLEAVRRHMSNFFVMLKSESRCLRFLFLTGITKYGGADLFSDLNLWIDISIDRKYGTFLGFTEEEIRRGFSPYLERAAGVLGKPSSEILSNILAHYGGYCFEETARQRVAIPGAVLDFLNLPEHGFQHCRFADGWHPPVFLQHLKKSELAEPESFTVPVTRRVYDLETPRPFEDFDGAVFLTQTGCLTIREAERHNCVVLDYPNREAVEAMARFQD